MTILEFTNIAKGMKAVYTDPRFIPDKDAMNVWFALFKDDPYDVTQAAVQKHMLTKSTPPTPADIKGYMVDLTNGESLNDEEAWQMVIRAVRNSNYNAEAEFDRLPANVQKAVATPANLRTMAAMDHDELHTIEKSHFMRTYRREVERDRDLARMPERIRDLIGAANQKMIGGAS